MKDYELAGFKDGYLGVSDEAWSRGRAMGKSQYIAGYKLGVYARHGNTRVLGRKFIKYLEELKKLDNPKEPW